MKARVLPVAAVMDEFKDEDPTKPEEPETLAETLERLRTETDRQRPTVRDMRPLEKS